MHWLRRHVYAEKKLMDLLSKPHQEAAIQVVPQFTKTGEEHSDLWIVNGNCNFGWFPAGRVPGIDIEIPIRLHIGNAVFGEYHIKTKHGAWLQKLKTEAQHMVWQKLQTSGHIYATEAEKKNKLSLRINPEALMVLELRKHRAEYYFSVVTLYAHPKQIDGRSLGRYIPKKMPINDRHF
jgi:hypothetical protein